jgi:orotidine-5'-phosphate decarboxylase
MGMRDFGYLAVSPSKKRLYHAVGEKLTELAVAHSGKYGYGVFGAVVGCTERDESAEIRRKYSNLFFLIPGYGAQGGAADDAALLLREGNGGVVNASRSILKAWSAELKDSGGNESAATNTFAAEAARKAAIAMRDAIGAAVKK